MNRIVVLLALLLFLPLFGLGVPFLYPQWNASSSASAELMASGTLSHLWNFVLGGYIASTLLLILGVGIGVFILGVVDCGTS